MNIDKDQIIEHLKSLGKHDDAAKAQTELPDKVDTDKDANLLEKYGVNPKDLGKLGGKLGGMLG